MMTKPKMPTLKTAESRPSGVRKLISSEFRRRPTDNLNLPEPRMRYENGLLRCMLVLLDGFSQFGKI
ncbi:hypothetical protein CICLE_v10003073mg [Citrus x clementina]|uniref:Uncharacterized protein n=1 Tax=Citrus clementina TaxID=85681 RepID=V4SVH9_CITCL|nr:hypothetical protein CICLE_v10003073mg [Citrus x clementina]